MCPRPLIPTGKSGAGRIHIAAQEGGSPERRSLYLDCTFGGGEGGLELGEGGTPAQAELHVPLAGHAPITLRVNPEVAKALKEAVTRGDVFPVACGVASKNLGTTAVLDLLVDSGIVGRVRIGDTGYRYERLRAGEHHDHLICNECGRVIEFFEPRIESLQDEVCERYGLPYNSGPFMQQLGITMPTTFTSSPYYYTDVAEFDRRSPRFLVRHVSPQRRR